ncbi:selenium-dependent molybdenum cofactor biosynthesis protein YqeB [Sporomusa sp. KB1]|uniref:selenium-dependent molybdenum cofactor biosynthesis protein YqeB n=1 Tax=Sporomusa sp. KB1 TaxID=943346 RepID=UPI00119FBA5F|nr:selenium-dependent molybdenum cofactor biosynthesis protein YqeB [Sporomusa sp. KB1]TWH48076.1 xanthine dehydrogenase accessory factor [Sporomusa sp. KB1]
MRDIVIVKGGGDIATGIANRLYQSHFNAVILELDKPTVVRRTVAFAQSVIQNSPVTVEGVTAKVVTLDEVHEVLSSGQIPVLLASEPFLVKKVIDTLKPVAVVDAIIAKRNLGTRITDAPVVIGVGPGFIAGLDVHAVVETNRGHDLGRVIYQGAASNNTGIPGNVGGFTIERLIKSQNAGKFVGCREIGDQMAAGEVVGYIDGVPVKVAITGILRGLLQTGLTVKSGMKLGDIDPRCRREHCFTISDKARAISGGVLEALLHCRGNNRAYMVSNLPMDCSGIKSNYFNGG